MIETLEITNFKSVKHLTLPCKRFNVFIGEPNTGKSNILEALGLVSFVGAWQYQPGIKLDGFVRHERTSNLFYDEEVGESVHVTCGKATLKLTHQGASYAGSFRHVPYSSTGGHEVVQFLGNNLTIDSFGSLQGYISDLLRPTDVKFYRFAPGMGFLESSCHYLLPPLGQNLPTLLLQNRELRNAVNSPFLSSGLRLGLRPQENKIELVKNFEDIIISYPYSLVSDTWQRMAFYTAALMTNSDSVLVFEEPEAHSFPHYTSHLAERIALDENNNQYFIVTHNPDFLMPLLEKSEKGQLAINIVYSEDYQTKVKEIPPSELPELFELDVFANLDRYLDP